MAEPKDHSDGTRWTHATKGGYYTLVGTAKLQTDTLLADLAEVVVYRGEDGRLWVRNATEFDTRFKRLRTFPNNR